jgi:hypothetical protein
VQSCFAIYGPAGCGYKLKRAKCREYSMLGTVFAEWRWLNASMRINLRRFEDGRQVGTLFNVVSKITIISFAVPIRHLRLPRDEVKTAPARPLTRWIEAGQEIQK